MTRVEWLHPTYLTPMRRMAAFLLLLAGVQLLAWLLPTWSDFKGIPYYLPLHVLLETISIIVSMMVFAVGWNSHSRSLSGNIVLLACVFFFVGMLDFLHTISYGGMPDYISHNDAQKHLNFWLSARLFAAIALLVISIRPWKPLESKASRYLIFCSLSSVTLLINWVVVYHQAWLPDTFISGRGLTPFKDNVEYLVIAINIITALKLLAMMRERRSFNIVLLFGAVSILAMSEFYFTLYTTMTGSYNVLGHIYKAIAYLLIYRAIVVEMIEEPYDLLKHSEDALKTSKRQLEEAQRLAKVGSWQVNFSKNEPYENWTISRELRSLWELDETADVTTGTGFSIMHPDDQDSTQRIWEEAKRGVGSKEWENRIIVNGRIKWISVVANFTFDAQGNPLYAIGTNQDITERKQAELAVHISEARLGHLLEYAPIGMATSTLDGHFIYANKAFCSMLGYCRDELEKITFQDITHPDDKTLTLSDRQKLLEGEIEVYKKEKRYIRKDGEVVWALITSTVETSDLEDPPYFIAQVEDITDRKRAEEALKLSGLIYQHSSEAMLASDADNRIVSINPAFTLMTGYTAEEVIGQSPKILSSGRQDAAFYRAMWNSINNTGQWRGEIWNRRKNGEVYAELLTINTIYNDDGSVHRRVALFSDITDQKDAEALILTQANYDLLTKLPNRRLFQDRLKQSLRNHRGKDGPRSFFSSTLIASRKVRASSWSRAAAPRPRPRPATACSARSGWPTSGRARRHCAWGCRSASRSGARRRGSRCCSDSTGGEDAQMRSRPAGSNSKIRMPSSSPPLPVPAMLIDQLCSPSGSPRRSLSQAPAPPIARLPEKRARCSTARRSLAGAM